MLRNPTTVHALLVTGSLQWDLHHGASARLRTQLGKLLSLNDLLVADGMRGLSILDASAKAMPLQFSANDHVAELRSG
jgi:hypothetical protein